MSYYSLHLLSTDHKCTHACFIKINVAQNKIIVWSFLKILEISRRMSPSQLPVKMKSAARINIYSLFKIKTVGHVIKHYYTLFRYDIDAVITCDVYHMCGT
jgi:hypothetical protein